MAAITPGVYHLGGGRMVRVDVASTGDVLVSEAVVEGKRARLVEVTGDRRAAVLRAFGQVA